MRGERCQGMRVYMAAYSATVIYVVREVVLMYFIVEAEIDTILREIKPSDWLELSENLRARANAGAVAAQRILYTRRVGTILFGLANSLIALKAIYSTISLSISGISL
jgi:hypothetical protein